MVIGAGPAGLAAAACLTRSGIPHVVLEQADRIAPSWHRHYERLHLHTPRQHSALPFRPFPRSFSTYPSRLQVIEYFDSYAAAFGIAPRFRETVQTLRPQNGAWITVTNSQTIRSANVIVASGLNTHPYAPDWPGRDAYGGIVLHSAEYRNGKSFRGQRALVVGFGNSGGEIAIDLCEHGAHTTLAVRGPVNVISRDILGIPAVSVGLALRFLPPRAMDRVAAPLRRLVLGNLADYGLEQLELGPAAQVTSRARVPLIDVGTLGLIKHGAVTVRPGIAAFMPDGVEFTDGRREKFDTVVLATGYRAGLGFLAGAAAPLARDPMRLPYEGRESSLPGLFFSGFHVPLGGTLRQIGMEARNIARRIAAKA